MQEEDKLLTPGEVADIWNKRASDMGYATSYTRRSVYERKKHGFEPDMETANGAYYRTSRAWAAPLQPKKNQLMTGRRKPVQNYYTLNFKLGDEISFLEAQVDTRYELQGFRDLEPKYGPYYDYRVIDFPDSESSDHEWARIGVRQDGFNGVSPIYYVRCQNVINRELRSTGETVIQLPEEQEETTQPAS